MVVLNVNLLSKSYLPTSRSVSLGLFGLSASVSYFRQRIRTHTHENRMKERQIKKDY